jgi:hypothetical protein
MSEFNEEASMSHGRVLVEEFEPDVLKWLRSKVELVVVDPWVEPERPRSEANGELRKR